MIEAERAEGGMEFGIFQGVHKDASIGVGDNEAIEHYLWTADFTEQNGFGTFWATEHHNSEYGIGGVPLLQLANLAARTERIRLGVAVVVPSLHHPLRLTEEALWVQHLSKGRLWLGFGPGFSQYEFRSYGVQLEDNHARMYEAVEFMQRAFVAPRVSLDGQFHQIGETEVMPRPYNGMAPPLFFATSQPASIQKAAAMGVNPLLGFRPPKDLAVHVQIYQEALAAMGKAQAEIADAMRYVGCLRRVVLADTPNEAISLVNLSGRRNQVLSQRVHQMKQGVQDVSAEEIGDKLLQLDGGAIAGTAEQVIAQLREVEALGIGHVLIAFGGRGMHPDFAKDQLRRFARDVMPAFQRVAA
jgi:alkanesulfonate monooxygenase SsuD/methylene tetrahydromethanopterin reductase-like flavin-dependent oxidoreductase (luciferase family)